MTEAGIERVLVEAFLTLDGISGLPLIRRDAGGNPLNVAFPNVPFTEPADMRYFALSFLPSAPEPAGLGENAWNRWTGVFQVDVMVPAGTGLEEARAKYGWLERLFRRGAEFGGVRVRRCYRAGEWAEGTRYRVTVRVEWFAALPA